MPELLGGHVTMTVIAQVARVAVLIAAAQRQRLDMVNDSSEADAFARLTHLAQARRASQASGALPLTSPTAQPLDNLTGHKRKPPEHHPHRDCDVHINETYPRYATTMVRKTRDSDAYDALDTRRVDARVQLLLLEERGASPEEIAAARALLKSLNAEIAALGLHGVR